MILKVDIRPIWERRLIANYRAVAGRSSYYGDDWIRISLELRRNFKRCQWCDEVLKVEKLAVHHIGCVKFNVDHKFDSRILLVVCRDCHEELEPWSRINLTQMLPQLCEN
jgi:hypothetical protein